MNPRSGGQSVADGRRPLEAGTAAVALEPVGLGGVPTTVVVLREEKFDGHRLAAREPNRLFEQPFTRLGVAFQLGDVHRPALGVEADEPRDGVVVDAHPDRPVVDQVAHHVPWSARQFREALGVGLDCVPHLHRPSASSCHGINPPTDRRPASLRVIPSVYARPELVHDNV